MNNKLAKTKTPKELLLPLTVVAVAVLLLKIIFLTRSYRLIPGSSKLERDFVAAKGKVC